MNVHFKYSSPIENRRFDHWKGLAKARFSDKKKRPWAAVLPIKDVDTYS